MTHLPEPQQVETIVIGGGQAGLAAGYHLSQLGLPYLILDARQRIGDAWRDRWDSLRLFTPARFIKLPGMPYPGTGDAFPTKNAVADYLEAYAARFRLQVQTGVRVERLSKRGERFVVTSGNRRFEAKNVVVAMSSYQLPRVPEFAADLSPDIVQMHSGQYRNPAQLQDGDVLVVGASDSGCEIALEVSRERRTWLSGRHPGHVPFRVDSFIGRHLGVPLVIGFGFHKVMTISTPVGRKLRPKLIAHSVGPNVRVKPRDIEAAGIERVPRVERIQDGLPVLEDQRVLQPSNVIWCTGFKPDFSWIDLAIFGDDGEAKEPQHHRGIVASQPGLYFVGLFFLYALSSSILRGVGRDAEYVARAIAARTS